MFTVIINPNKQIVKFLVSVWTNVDRMTDWKQYFTIWKDRKKWGVRGLLELWKFNVTCWEWIAQSSWNIPHSNGLGQSLVYSLSLSAHISLSLCLSVSFILFFPILIPDIWWTVLLINSTPCTFHTFKKHGTKPHAIEIPLKTLLK